MYNVRLKSFNQHRAIVIKAKYQGDKRAAWRKFYQQPAQCQQPKTLQFFAYCNEDNISKDEKLHLCYKMALASLIGEKMFNFSELIEKEYFKVLIDSKYEWIYNLIRSLSSGKVDQFMNMVANYKDNFEKETNKANSNM